MTFTEDYMRGLNSLFASASAFANLAQSLGKPFANPSIPTARVSFDSHTKLISFEINPNYIEPLTDGEIAAVIAHETYHVLLDHFDEITDRTTYPDQNSLKIAQECIINDGLFANVGFHLPEGVCSGPKDHGQDFSWFTSKQGYEFLTTPPEDSDEDSSDADSDDSDSSSGGNGDASSSSTSSDDNQDDSENPSESSDNTPSDSDSEETSDSKSDEESDEDAESEGASSDASDDSDADNSEDDTEETGSGTSCGGIVVNDEDLQNFKDAVSNAVNNALDSVPASTIPDELADVLDNLADTEGIQIDTSGWSIGTVDKSGAFMDTSDTLELNWKMLLAKINPAIMSSNKPKYRDSWHQPRRKMLNSYPSVVLPTSRRVDSSNGKGDEVPTFILALDMSYSIPTYLIQKLASLADSIPTDIIRPTPVTWSDVVKEFDTTERRIVSRSGTNIDAVYTYAENFEKRTKTKPYVLVITDGECQFNQWRIRNSGHDFDSKKVNDRWIWMAITQNDKKNIQRNFGSHIRKHEIYCMQDFM